MDEHERTEVPLHGDERAMLNAFLDWQRDTLAWKCTGLSDAQLRMVASPPSSLTLLGLLRHLTEVEYFWFEAILTGRPDRLGMYSGSENPAGADWNKLLSHPSEVFCRAGGKRATTQGATPPPWPAWTHRRQWLGITSRSTFAG